MEETKRRIWEYLQTQNLMSLGTYGTHLWVANVYYVVDDELNLYFLSSPDTQHCRDIAMKSTVVCSILDSQQKVTDEKIGVQLRGTAEQVKDWLFASKIIDMWNRKHPGLEEFITLENVRKRKISSLVFQIKPRYIKFFNEKLYGEEGCEVLKLN